MRKGMAGILLFACVAVACLYAAEPVGKILLDFEDSVFVEELVGGQPSVNAKQVQECVTGGENALQFTLPEGRYVAIRLRYLPVSDWSGYAGIEFDICQTAGDVERLFFFIYDTAGKGVCNSIDFSPGREEPQHCSFTFADMKNIENLDLRDIKRVQFYISKNESDKTYIVDSIRLIPAVEPEEKG